MDDGTFGAYAEAGTLTKIETQTLYCAEAGNSIMVRKDQAGMLKWWNEAFSKLKTSGKYKELCDKASRDYGKYNVKLIGCKL